ncbi:hypothetical protein [Herbidospora galbida]|uniref:hypothetical protein n=1 Tax=Herbidospora galbida TaxID=2575442 RepID=UPI001FE37629|nr:hypothetical protein [Herbidospora galbida]
MPHILDPVGGQPRKLTLNTDGRPHRLQNTLCLSVFTIGVFAFIFGFIVVLHVPASWLGAIGFFTGLFSQFISVTTPQRVFNIMGIVGSFVGAGLGIAHGGFV